MSHSITPNPKGAHPIFEALFEGMRSQGLLPPAPVPMYPVDDIPADRSDETRDSLASGV